MNKKQQKEFMELVTPLQQWIANNLHPHHKIILDTTYVEVLEGEFVLPDNKDVNIPD